MKFSLGMKPATWLLGGAAVVLVAAVAARGWYGGAGVAPVAAASADAVPASADPEHWRQAGAQCFDANDFACAVDSYQKAVALAPGRAALWSALGEARVMASAHEPMPADALDAFRKAIALDVKDPRARYFLAVNKDLGGDHKGAIADWIELLGDTRPGAPWEKDLRRTIEQVGKINHIPVGEQLAAVHQPAASTVADAPQHPALPGPSQQELASATAIPPGEQRSMAEAMVARLEQRLASEPHNSDGWIMLMRSRINLDQQTQARAALARALQADPGDAPAIHAGARELGLE